MTNDGDLNVDHLITRLLEVRGCRPGKTVQMSENEIRALCHKSREIFLSQPILLELEAPLKICGKYCWNRRIIFELFRWHSWSVQRFTSLVWIWWIPSRSQLFVFGRLCGSWKTKLGGSFAHYSSFNFINLDNMLVVGLQDQVPRKFLPTSR